MAALGWTLLAPLNLGAPTPIEGSVMKKTRRKAAKKPKIKKVVLTPATVLQVVVPKDIVPVVAQDPEARTVEIAPVPRSHQRKSWWETLWGS